MLGVSACESRDFGRAFGMGSKDSNQSIVNAVFRFCASNSSGGCRRYKVENNNSHGRIDASPAWSFYAKGLHGCVMEMYCNRVTIRH